MFQGTGLFYFPKNMFNFLAILSLISSSISPAYLTTGAEEGVVENLPAIKEAHEVYVTAYSSTPGQTDDTPFITATGNTVRDGIIAANFLDFGTEVQIPELFGEEVFVVDDRMHPRKKNFIDVWMPTREDALRFGITYATILVLE